MLPAVNQSHKLWNREVVIRASRKARRRGCTTPASWLHRNNCRQSYRKVIRFRCDRCGSTSCGFSGGMLERSL